MQPGSELPLVEGACLQFPSHASGDVRIGPDGFLYASVGDGASFDFEDYGQAGNTRVPATLPTRAGRCAARTSAPPATPLGLGGSIVRINPANGLAAERHRRQREAGSSPTASATRGGSRSGPAPPSCGRPTSAAAPGRRSTASRWPRLSGAGQPRLALLRGHARAARPGSPAGTRWTSRSARTCTPPGAGAVQAPYFGYQTRGPLLTPGEHCESSTSSVSGVAFAPPAQQLARGLPGLAVLLRLRPRVHVAAGQASPTATRTRPASPRSSSGVDAGRPGRRPERRPVLRRLRPGRAGVPEPGAGGIHRIAYRDPAPVAVLTADRISGPLSATYDVQRGRHHRPQRPAR